MVAVYNPLPNSPARRPSAEIYDIGARRKPGSVEVEDQDGQPQTVATIIADDEGGIQIEVSHPGSDQEAEPDTGPDNDFNRNLALEMNDDALDAICQTILDGVDSDIQDRREWEETANVATKYLGIKLEDPATSVSADGTVSKAIATCMIEALVKIWANSRAELLPVSGPVKVRDDQTALARKSKKKKPQPGIGGAAGQAQAGGIAAQPQAQDHPPSEDELAESLQSDLNHYLTQIDKEYYPDFSKMLLNRALVGLAFRKVFHDPLKRRPVSTWVKAQNLVVSNDCAHLEGAGRITEIIRMRQSTMRRMMVNKAYRDIPLVSPTGQVTQTELAVAEQEGVMATPPLPADFQHMVYETRTEIGSTASHSFIGDLSLLDKDENGTKPGYPLPYRVAIDVDSRAILEIRRDWKKGDPDHKRRRTYVKYGFIPGVGFYDSGLIHLVGNPTQAATMLQRAGVDASLFANFPGGIFLKGPASRQSSTVIRPNPGEFVGVDGNGATRAQDVFMPMPYKDPSPQSLALQQKFESDVRRLTGTIEIPVGEGRVGNTPVGTIMSYIEAISQVPSAIHKDDHITQQEEYSILRELLAECPGKLIEGNPTPARESYTAQELLSPDLVPAADPNTPSQVHRLMKVQARVTIGGLPQFQGIPNQRAIYEDAMIVLGGDPDEFTQPPAPPQAQQPPPQVIAAQIRATSQQQTDQAKMDIAETQATAKMQETQAEAEQRELDRQSDETKAAMTLRGKQLDHSHDATQGALDRAQDHVHHVDDQAQAAQQAAAQPTQGSYADGGAIDPLDFSNRYNTKLTPQQEKQYQAWATKNNRVNDTYDYDMRGAWKAGAGKADNGHFPDTYKKPNHPTFSNESIYNGVDSYQGGTWGKDNSFTPGTTNLQLHSPSELQHYFRHVEPGSQLNLPADNGDSGTTF